MSTPTSAMTCLRDFTPVSQIRDIAVCAVANPFLPSQNVKEFIALARSSPRKDDVRKRSVPDRFRTGA